MSTISIYTDGACKCNPGPGGYAAIITVELGNGLIAEKGVCGGFRLTTNNRMELLAVIEGLRALKTNKRYSVTIYSDSQYIVNAINKGWLKSWVDSNFKNGTVKNIDLWKELLKLLKLFDVNFVWVKGHNGIHYNESCDALAKQSCTRNDLGIDRVFESTYKGNKM